MNEHLESFYCENTCAVYRKIAAREAEVHRWMSDDGKVMDIMAPQGATAADLAELAEGAGSHFGISLEGIAYERALSREEALQDLISKAFGPICYN